MAQYYGTVKGGRGEASRLGHKTSGLRTTCTGWNAGVECYAYWNEVEQRDEFSVDLTRGSPGRCTLASIRYYHAEGQPRLELSGEVLKMMSPEALRDAFVAFASNAGSEATETMLQVANAMCEANPQFAAAFLASAMAHVKG